VVLPTGIDPCPDLEVFRSLVVPIFAVICIIAWLYMRKRAEKILGKFGKSIGFLCYSACELRAMVVSGSLNRW